MLLERSQKECPYCRKKRLANERTFVFRRHLDVTSGFGSKTAEKRFVFFRRAALFSFILSLSSVLSVFTSDDAFFIFKPLPARSGNQLKNWSAINVPANVAGALTAYETAPSMKTAIGVLQHYKFFAKAENRTLRIELLNHDPQLFQTVDAAKYELIMQAQKKISQRFSDQGGIAFGIRVGSSGKRHYQ